MRMIWIPLLALACGVESEEESERADAGLFAEMLAPPSTGGCGDVTLFASASGDTRAIFVNINGLVGQAHASVSGMVSGSTSLPSSMMSVRGEEGTALTSATCVGAFPFPGPMVSNSWRVVSGTANYEATAVPGGPPFMPLATVSVRLRNVVLEDAAGNQLTLRRMRWNDVTVGFYPP